MRQLFFIVLGAILLCILPAVAFAEPPAGKITGTVKDPDGAIVSGASVSLLHTNQAVVRATVTDNEGVFTLENIEPGDYQLSVERNGFVRHRSAIHVTHEKTQQVTVVLEVTPLVESVTITAEAGVVADTRQVETQVNIINERKILERATEVVAQVVDEEPGVNLQRTSPSLSAVFVRGLTGRNVAIYVDGVRYTTSAQRGGVGTFFSLIEPSSPVPVRSVLMRRAFAFSSRPYFCVP